MPIRTLFYSKPESGMHVTEMMTCDWSMIIVDIFMCCDVVCSVVIRLFFQIFSAIVYSWCQKFSFQTHTHGSKTGTEKRRQKKWSRFMAPVSGARVMGLDV